MEQPTAIHPDTRLPSPRALLTSLIASLPASTHSAPFQQDSDDEEDDACDEIPSRASLLPPEAQPILATLHVLYPALVLPALDLLDRRLVTRVIEANPVTQRDLKMTGHDGDEDQAPPAATDTGSEQKRALAALQQPHQHPLASPAADSAKAVERADAEQVSRQSQAPEANASSTPLHSAAASKCASTTRHGEQYAVPRARRNCVFLVRSAQHSFAGSHRRQRSSGGGGGSTFDDGRTYTVRLQAWHCSCAAFAFAAFPTRSQDLWRERLSSATRRNSDPTHVPRLEAESEEEGSKWEFGGLSKDGQYPAHLHRDGTDDIDQDLPCCKHLLACVFAERWADALRGYVKKMKVDKLEMAGLASGS